MISFKRIKDLREDNDLTQKQMAEILGVKRPAYSLWEIGISIIPLDHLSDFADYYNVSIDYVLGLSNIKNSKRIIKGFDKKILGNNLKKYRNKNNFSQEDIANIIGVTSSAIQRYEKGLILISLQNLYEYSKIFKISISELCGKLKK